MSQSLTRLSKVVAVALRHRPWEFELELDAEGWVPIEQLLDALHDHRAWRDVTRSDLEAMVAGQSKPRYEIAGDRIRALYGHSVPIKIQRALVTPPPMLYHGTAHRFLDGILADGLRPKGRQYVHLSRSVEMAETVGRRRDARPVILQIDALAAERAGVIFYEGNGEVFLADHVPPIFLSILSS